ncbi:MAG TPA: nucleotidyl transferase AbiEii/AbiGii toxin family protein [Bacilli bacterium]|nr:nucleotidyl transferase AbiEii/AbiGii toxin family protein [Bacilli bacterium]
MARRGHASAFLDVRYATERFLMRISKSAYKEAFVIKGGVLLGLIFEDEARATRDLDIAVRIPETNTQEIIEKLQKICDIDIDDGLTFVINGYDETRANEIYPSLHVRLTASFKDSKTKIGFHIDLAVGDLIIPSPKATSFPLMFQETRESVETIELYTYPKETVLAEKLETILRRGDANSRYKDFYDCHMLWNTDDDSGDQLDIQLCLSAFRATVTARRHLNQLVFFDVEEYLLILNDIRESDKMSKGWEQFTSETGQELDGLSFKETVNEMESIIQELYKEFQKDEE